MDLFKQSLYVINIVVCTSLATSGCTVSTQMYQGSISTATRWIQSSGEYKATTTQVYNLAAFNLNKALEDLNWTSVIEQKAGYERFPAAIVMDIDETVLSNSNYHSKLIARKKEHTPILWDNWISLRSATAVPGAVDFINLALEKGIEIYYVSNRECRARDDSTTFCPQKIDTLKNLEGIGIKELSLQNILLKNEKPEWASNKKKRRQFIAQTHRVLMLFGDDLNDFTSSYSYSLESRENLVSEYKSYWGSKWYILSNPTYGSWMNPL